MLTWLFVWVGNAVVHSPLMGARFVGVARLWIAPPANQVAQTQIHVQCEKRVAARIEIDQELSRVSKKRSHFESGPLNSVVFCMHFHLENDFFNSLLESLSDLLGLDRLSTRQTTLALVLC